MRQDQRRTGAVLSAQVGISGHRRDDRKAGGTKDPRNFAQDGEAAFRQMEAQTAASLGRRRNTVISTGGGFLMQPETVKALRENGGGFEAIVFLDCSFETCYRRIQTSDRPLVRNNTKEGLEEIFNARREKYLSVAWMCSKRRNHQQHGRGDRRKSGDFIGVWEWIEYAAFA